MTNLAYEHQLANETIYDWAQEVIPTPRVFYDFVIAVLGTGIPAEAHDSKFIERKFLSQADPTIKLIVKAHLAGEPSTESGYASFGLGYEDPEIGEIKEFFRKELLDTPNFEVDWAQQIVDHFAAHFRVVQNGEQTSETRIEA